MAADSDLASWDAAAERYAAVIGGETDSFYRRFAPFLWEQLGSAAGRRILDVGCGHGWLSGLLAAQGASVLGVDGSANLIAAAKATQSGIDFLVHDLTDPLPPELPRFDAAVAHMVLMDLPTVDVLLEGLRHHLVPRGTFVFSILHPAFYNQPIVERAEGGWERRVAGYLGQQEWRVTTFGGHRHYHRPLGWYIDRLHQHGFVVSNLAEPRSLPHNMRPESEWSDRERWFATIPTMLAVSARTE